MAAEQASKRTAPLFAGLLEARSPWGGLIGIKEVSHESPFIDLVNPSIRLLARCRFPASRFRSAERLLNGKSVGDRRRVSACQTGAVAGGNLNTDVLLHRRAAGGVGQQQRGGRRAGGHRRKRTDVGRR